MRSGGPIKMRHQGIRCRKGARFSGFDAGLYAKNRQHVSWHGFHHDYVCKRWTCFSQGPPYESERWLREDERMEGEEPEKQAVKC